MPQVPPYGGRGSHLAERGNRQEDERPADELREAVRARFEPGGDLAASLSGYELREGQLQMAEAVSRALAEERDAVVEAGTGVGKSLAYLVPAVLSRKQVVVTTATKSLQDQLWNKDIPFLQRVLGRFDAAVVKGMSNYLCLDRWEELNRQLDLSSNKGRDRVERWIRSTWSGELAVPRAKIWPSARLPFTHSSMRVSPPKSGTSARTSRRSS